MSYLNPLRLTFAGKFQAATSTVNNDPRHFDNASFKPEYQQRGPGATKGWWNPRGDANWRLIGCRIASASLADGRPVPAGDPVLTCFVADSDRSVAAKLVDLDSEQQLVSEIWGLQIRIADGHGHTLMRGTYEPAAFMNIWNRWPTGSGDGMAGAIYQSVITGIEWGDIGGSPFLAALRHASKDGLLSIKFNVDAFDADFTSPTFTLGRIAGCIGPAHAEEPRHFVIGRQFLTTDLNKGGFFTPAGQVNLCSAVVDSTVGKVILDLGNSLPTESLGGPFSNIGTLSVACVPTDPHAKPIALGEVDYRAHDWYERTAGVVAVPADRTLSADELRTLEAHPLVIQLTPAGGKATNAIQEAPGGVYVRADKYVFRLNPGESAAVALFASVYGKPYANAEIVLKLDPGQLQGGKPDPDVGVPENILHFPHAVSTGSRGEAVITLRADDPGNPRKYIDGQVYGIRPQLKETLAPSMQYPVIPWDYVSVLVWSEFRADSLDWHTLKPIFQQYANLYPIMDRFVDLSSYDSICLNLIPLTIAFGLERSDPNFMPVTRDLSASRQKAILKWLTHLQDGKPVRGTAPPAHAAPAVEAAASIPAHVTGGKFAAAMRRVAHRRTPHQS